MEITIEVQPADAVVASHSLAEVPIKGELPISLMYSKPTGHLIVHLPTKKKVLMIDVLDIVSAVDGVVDA